MVLWRYFHVSFIIFRNLHPGILADTSLGGAGGDFLEDISDIVDMYLWSFQDVTQLHEGRTLFDPYARAWNRGADYKTTSNLSFMNVCLRLITIAYISLVRG